MTTTSMTPMKTYRRHNCRRRHHTYLTLARCMFPRANWIVGEGEHALISWCRGTSVSLWPTLEEAEGSKDILDRTRCGGRCIGNHEIVRIVQEPA